MTRLTHDEAQRARTAGARLSRYAGAWLASLRNRRWLSATGPTPADAIRNAMYPSPLLRVDNAGACAGACAGAVAWSGAADVASPCERCDGTGVTEETGDDGTRTARCACADEHDAEGCDAGMYRRVAGETVIAYACPSAAAEAARTSGGVVLLGDCDEDGGEFWVATHDAAAVLVAAGYAESPC